MTSWDHWFSAPMLEMGSSGCFAPGRGGSEQLQEIVDRYQKAWSSGDKAQIAALYRQDASFSDTMLGLQAQGPAAIAELSDKRFGSASKITFKLIDLYALTNGPDPPTEQLPDQGAIVGLGIHYRRTLAVEGTPKTVEGTHHLRTRHLDGRMVRPRPERPDHPGRGVPRRRQPRGVWSCALTPGAAWRRGTF